MRVRLTFVFRLNHKQTLQNCDILLLSTYKFIVIPITYRNFGVFVYDAAEKQMINAISLVIEQRKNEFDRIARVRFFQNLLSCPASVISLSDTCQALCLAEMVFPNLFVCLARVISLSRHLPGSNFSREGDIASTQNLLLSFKPIICKLNYSHVKKHFIKERQPIRKYIIWSHIIIIFEHIDKPMLCRSLYGQLYLYTWISLLCGILCTDSYLLHIDKTIVWHSLYGQLYL